MAWVITPVERARHDQQFAAMRPIGGFITGDQARDLFMKSQLPPAILAHVWNLADMNKDGKMDANEFSIAMYLITKKLQGAELPQVLPDSLKHAGAVPVPTSGYGWGQPAQPMVSSYGTLQASNAGYSAPMQPARPASAGPQDWSMPEPVRLRYGQMFNQLDKSRTGYLPGVRARNILADSKLPNMVLAQVWNLADADRDGALSVDEFAVAMHLIEAARTGRPLPSVLPAELKALTCKSASGVRSTSTLPTAGQQGILQALGVPQEAILREAAFNDLGESPQKNSPVFASFEDRRKENFDRGQQELEKRRHALAEQERREREERERKERELAEKRERERQEVERRRQLEQERLAARQREIEAQRLEEQRKILAQRDELLRQKEKQRQLDAEKSKLVDETKQRQKNMSFQLQALNEEAAATNEKITQLRQQIVEVTGEIEGMKGQRDSKLTEMEQTRRRMAEIQEQLNKAATARVALQRQKADAAAHSTQGMALQRIAAEKQKREENIQRMKDEMERMKVEMERHLEADPSDRLSSLRSQLRSAAQTNRDQFAEYSALRDEALAKVNSFDPMSTAVGGALYEGILQCPALLPGAAWGDEGFTAADPFAAAYNEGEDPFASQPIGADAFGADDGWGAQQETTWAVPSASEGATAAAGAGGNTARYRALYEFVARNADELSFQPGDIVLVFKDTVGEEGWLAGQVFDKVGWFPAAFAECIDESGQKEQVASAFAPETTTTVSPTKLPSIHESLNEVTAASPSHEGELDSAPNANQSESQNYTTSIVYAVAQYPYKAKKDTHLSLQKNERVRVLERQEMWWRGELNGVDGWFPKSYVKVVEEVQQTTNGTKPDTPAGANTTTSSGSSGGAWYRAIYPFAAPESGDLRFNAADRIWVTGFDGDWWTGELDGRTGIFPATYVAPDEEVASPSATVQNDTTSITSQSQLEVGTAIAPFTAGGSNQLSLQQGDLVKIRAKSPTGWFEGEVEGRPGVSGWFPGNYVQMNGSESSAPQSPSKPPGSSQPAAAAAATATATAVASPIVVALYDYAPQHDDELQLVAGAKIIVVEKRDPDWWTGRMVQNPEKQGLFPSNYVQPEGQGAR